VNPIIYVVIAVVVIAALYFLFGRKSETRELPEEPEKLPKKPASKPAAKKRPAPEKAAKPAAKPAPAASEAEPSEEDDEDDEDDEDVAPVEDEEEVEPSKGPPPPPVSRRKRDVKGLRRGLKKVRGEGGLFGRLKALFTGKKEIDPGIVDDIEEILLTSDVGMKTTQMLLEEIREGLEKNELDDTDRVWELLRERAHGLLDIDGDGPIRNHGTPTVVLLVGVNGTGKTTTIGKLATQFANEDKKLLLVAGDTFRAAAVQQLQAWGQRVGCEVFAGEDEADPASVVFDAIKKGEEEGVDLILVDTAGRLHTKSNLMDELKKVVKVCGKALDGAPHETLLVLDGTTGQNALQQAKEFGDALDLTGLVLTKLDGTAKGGIVLAIAHEQGLPVRYIGVGERRQDLRDFDPEEFVEAMLGTGDGSQRAA